MATPPVLSVGTYAPSFLGVAPSFPFRLDVTGARPSLSKDEQLVLESMDQIINTNVGERPKLVRNGVPYGTRLKTVMFDSVAAGVAIAKYDVKRALDAWEPRIIVDLVDVQEALLSNGGSALAITTFFQFRSTNRADNLVTVVNVKRTS